MKINQLKTTALSEALNQPYPYRWVRKEDRVWTAQSGNIEIGFATEPTRVNDWSIVFDVDGQMDLTGDGEAFRILATVVAATKDWWSQQTPDQINAITFSATKDEQSGTGRERLYKRFAQQFARSIGFIFGSQPQWGRDNTTEFVLTNPNFRKSVTEDGRVVKGVNTTADVKTGETRRQAAKFGNKINHKNEPPLLNDRARRNSNPHLLSNLGLTESTQLTELFDKVHDWNWIQMDDLAASATFLSADDGDIEVFFTYSTKNKTWEVEFTKNFAYDATNEGDQFAIFATVMEIIGDFVHIRHPSSIVFSAEKNTKTSSNSRAGLYTKMINKFASKINMKSTVNDQGWKTDYKLVKEATVNESTRLTEVFDKIHDWKWVSMDDDFAQAVFKSADDGQVRVNFELGLLAKARSTLRPNGAWDVDFVKNSTFFATNEGDQFAIFATVMEIISDFVHIRNPDSIIFSADKNVKTGSNSRAGLYTRMVNKFASKINMKSTITNKGQKTDYKLVKEAAVTESLDKPYPYNIFQQPDWKSESFVASSRTPNGELLVMIDVANNEYVIDFAVNNSMGETGAGDEFRIFATVKDVVMGWLSSMKAKDIKSIDFSAEKTKSQSDSRARLYTRFANIMARTLGFELQVRQSGGTDNPTTHFVMTNPKFIQPVSETIKLTELFNKTHTWNWASKSPTMWKASFESADGGDMEVYIQSDKQASVHYDVAFKKAGTIKRTGDGDQFAILATVMDIIDTFLKQNTKAESIGFTARREGAAADNPKIRDSRASLYKKMLTKVAKANDFEIAWDEVFRVTEFMLRRKTTEVSEGINTINHGKDAKFGIQLNTYMPEGKQIGKVGKFQLWFTNAHTMRDDAAAQLWDPSRRKMVGFVELSAQSRRKFAKNTYISAFAVVDEDYAGKGIVYKIYVKLLQLGYSIVSDDFQTLGGKKIWSRLAKTAGINVYAIANLSKGHVQFSSVNPDDLTDADFSVYNDDEANDLFDTIDDMEEQYKDLITDIEWADEKHANGNGLPQEEYQGLKDYTAMFKKELADTKREYVAMRTGEKAGSDARLMATADTLSEGIRSLDNNKSEKFGIRLEQYKPQGKQIGKVGKYQLWFTSDHSDTRLPTAQIWDPKQDMMAGLIKLDQNAIKDMAANTYITSTAVVNDDYAGKGIVYKAYVALLKLGYNLISDNYQTAGGKRIWSRLANTTGIHVYAVIPGSRGKEPKYSAVDADDLTAGNFRVYEPSEEDEEYEDQLYHRYDKMEQQMVNFTTGDELDDHKDKMAMVKKELDATIRDRKTADKDYIGNNSARLMATADTLSEGYKKPRPEDTLGVSRADMPQVHANHYPELFEYLKANGAKISKGNVAATELKAVQGEFSDEGVAKMMRKDNGKGGTTRKKPLIVSADNYIIDGHHRWLAAYNLEEDIPIIKFSLPVKELLQLVHDFKHTTYRGIYNEAKVKPQKFTAMEQACIDGGHDLNDIT